MAKTEIDCDQLDAAKQIVEITKIYSGLVEKNNIILRTQLEICHQISICSSAASESVASTAESLANAAENVQDLNNTTLDDLRGQFNDVNDKIEKTEGWFSKIGNFLGKVLKGAAAVGAWALEKFWGVLKGIYYIGKQLVGILFSVVKEIFNIAKALINIPVQAYQWLIDKANGMLGGGSNEWYAALQKVKAEYGALDQVAPKTLISMTRNTQSLREVGLSAFKIYEGLGKRLEKMLEFAQKLGPLFENFSQEFEKTGLKLPTLAKGLGLTDEMNQIVVARAKTLGTKIEDQLLGVHKLSWELGHRYSFATKGISRDIVNAMKDVKHFGGASMSQLGAASVYAKSLGAELDKISGILDAFDTFENAADVAAKTAQTWNVDIDPYALLHEQDPTAIIENVRDAFARAGHDVTKFSRAEKDHLSQLYKLSPEMAQQLFSLHNQGISLENAKDAANTASKSFNTLDNALRQLNESIEYIPQSGGGLKFTGFFDAWWQGLERGAALNPQLKGLFRDVAKGLKTTYYDTKRVFDAFIEYFPGVKQMILALREIFNPTKLGTLVRGINNEIIKFLKNFSSGQMDFGQLISNIGSQFEKYLGSASAGGSKFLAGLRTFGIAVAKIAGQVIEWVGKMIAEGIMALASFIANPPIDEIVNGASKAGGAVAKVATSIWDPLWKGFEGFWAHLEPALGKLKDALIKQFPVIKKFFDLFETVSHQPMEWDEAKKGMINKGPPEDVMKIEALARKFWDDVVEGFNNLFNSNDSVFKKILNVLDEFKTHILILTASVIALGAAKILLSRMPGIAAAASTAGKIMSGAALGAATFAGVQLFTSGDDEQKEGAQGDAASAAKTTNGVSFDGLKNAIAPLLGAAGDTFGLGGFDLGSMLGGASPEVIRANVSASASVSAAAPAPAPAEIPIAQTAGRARRERLDAANFSANLSFDQVGEAIGSIVQTAGGTSTIKTLVKSLNTMGETINANKAVASANTVAQFFTHVNTLASALAGMQELVDIPDLKGEGNVARIGKNISDFEALLGAIAGGGESGPLGKIANHMTVLHKLLPSAGVVNSIKGFVEAIENIAGSLKGISDKSIDSTALGLGLDSITTALGVLKGKIGPLKTRLGEIAAEAGRGGLRTLNLSIVKPFADNLKNFASHFEIIKDALTDIAASSEEFKAEGGIKIDAATLGAAIKGVSDGITALVANTTIPDGNPLGTLSSSLGRLVSSSGRKWVISGDYKGISTKLSVLSTFLAEITGHISGTTEGSEGLLESFSVLSEFSEKLGPNGEYGKNFVGADFNTISTFLDRVASSMPDSSALEARIGQISGKLSGDDEFSKAFRQIDVVLQRAQEVKDKIEQTKGVAKSFEETLKTVPAALKLGNPQHIKAQPLQIIIGVEVKLDPYALEQGLLSTEGSKVRASLIALNESGGQPVTLPI